jgi:hypothetical protein
MLALGGGVVIAGAVLTADAAGFIMGGTTTALGALTIDSTASGAGP